MISDAIASGAYQFQLRLPQELDHCQSLLPRVRLFSAEIALDVGHFQTVTWDANRFQLQLPQALDHFRVPIVFSCSFLACRLFSDTIDFSSNLLRRRILFCRGVSNGASTVSYHSYLNTFNCSISGSWLALTASDRAELRSLRASLFYGTYEPPHCFTASMPYQPKDIGIPRNRTF